MLLDEDPAYVRLSQSQLASSQILTSTPPPSPSPQVPKNPHQKANTIPKKYIRECTSKFRGTSDKDALSRITESLSMLRQSRSARLSSNQTSLKHISKRLHSLQQQHDIETGSHDPAAHSAEIMRLDGLKFRVAKEASDAEIEGERLEGEVRRLTGVKEGLDQESELGTSGLGRSLGEEGDRDVYVFRAYLLLAVDGIADLGRNVRNRLKLKLYRSLGVDLESNGSGRCTRAVVRDVRKGTASVLDLDPQEPLSRYTNSLWEVL